METYSEHAIRRAVSVRDAVPCVRRAFRVDGEGGATVPPVINLEVPDHRGEFHIKTALVKGEPIVAVKVASGFYDNPARGLPSGSGLMLLFDARTGFPAAVLADNGYLTDLRTGAAGAVAAEYLARADAATAGVIGSGVQARLQVLCLREVRPIARVVAWSRTRASLEAYCAEMREAGLEARPSASIEEVCKAADVLVTTTPAREPLVRAGWLRPGMHVTAVGSDSPGKQELDPACFARADLVVADRVTQCASFGEIAHALSSGSMTMDQVVELGAVVAGRRPGRSAPEQITIADLTGVGFQDTAIAALALRELRRRGSEPEG
jgi:ornithine cyclodeaminase